MSSQHLSHQGHPMTEIIRVPVTTPEKERVKRVMDAIGSRSMADVMRTAVRRYEAELIAAGALGSAPVVRAA
jgi:hypothetical protein